MELKKLFMENIEPHTTATIKECHRHINFFAYNPSHSFPVILFYNEYSDTDQKVLTSIQVGTETIPDWSNPDDLYQQIDDALSLPLIEFLEKEEGEFHKNECIEDVMEKIQFCIERDGIEVDPD